MCKACSGFDQGGWGVGRGAKIRKITINRSDKKGNSDTPGLHQWFKAWLLDYYIRFSLLLRVNLFYSAVSYLEVYRIVHPLRFRVYLYKKAILNIFQITRLYVFSSKHCEFLFALPSLLQASIL